MPSDARAVMIQQLLQLALFDALGPRLTTITVTEVDRMLLLGNAQLHLSMAEGRDAVEVVDDMVDAMMEAIE